MHGLFRCHGLNFLVAILLFVFQNSADLIADIIKAISAFGSGARQLYHYLTIHICHHWQQRFGSILTYQPLVNYLVLLQRAPSDVAIDHYHAVIRVKNDAAIQSRAVHREPNAA